MSQTKEATSCSMQEPDNDHHELQQQQQQNNPGKRESLFLLCLFLSPFTIHFSLLV